MCENNELPDYLYHYTTINTLALILKYKTIRFNCLRNVDDLNEGIVNDLGKIGKYFFISCWTDKSEESIPFWKMYTNNMVGVRIKLPVSPFKLHSMLELNIDNATINMDYSIHRPENLFEKDYMPTISNNILNKVHYTNEREQLYPNIYEITENNEHRVHLNKVGIFKRKEWNFQSEWRYIIKIMPMGFNEIIKNGADFGKIMFDLIRSERPLPINEYYLDLDCEKFKDMEITLGPGITEGDKIIVNSLVNKYNPSATIIESSLMGEIR